jgi:cell division protein FtsX
MSDYNKRLLGISVGAIFYIIFFLLDWSDLFYSYEINFNQNQSFFFDAFDLFVERQEDIFQILWSILSIAWIGAFWVFRDTVGNFVFSIFQWIKGKI